MWVEGIELRSSESTATFPAPVTRHGVPRLEHRENMSPFLTEAFVFCHENKSVASICLSILSLHFVPSRKQRQQFLSSIYPNTLVPLLTDKVTF